MYQPAHFKEDRRGVAEGLEDSAIAELVREWMAWADGELLFSPWQGLSLPSRLLM